MCYLGSPIGFFVFPPIFETLVNKYGLSGTFLVLSGINMHCIPLSMLLRQPNFKSKNEKCPLNHGEKCDSYSSTDSATRESSQKHKNASKNGSIEEIGCCPERHSIVFGAKEQDKRYIIAPNKKSFFQHSNNTKNQISFENTSWNHYENPDNCNRNGLSSVPHKYRIESHSQSVLHNNNKNLSSFKIVKNSNCFGPPLPNLEISTILQLRKNEEFKNPHFPKNLEREGISTIYLGNNGHTRSADESKSLNHRSNLETREVALNFPCHTKAESIFHVITESNLPILLKYKTSDELNDEICNTQMRRDEPYYIQSSTESRNPLLIMWFNPIFILMCIINAIVNIHFTALTTVVIDFSRDHHIDIEYEKYILMGISLSGAFGMLGFGWVTDGSYLTRTKFGAITQLISSVTTVVLPFTVGFETLMVTLAIWCICQSSFIPLIPAVIADYFEEDLQAVAISACNVLSGPLYLIIPPLIGKLTQSHLDCGLFGLRGLCTRSLIN